MLRIQEAIVVEGRYDKNTLSQLVDTVILETSGFGIFKDREKQALFRRLAQTRGLIILTDSDGAGFLIRGHLKGVLPEEGVKHAYIPDRYGKERRKRHPGREGKLGVEGMSPQVLEESLRRAGATFLDKREPLRAEGLLTKADLYALGLSGGTGSNLRRRALLHRLDLPENLSANGMLDLLNALLSREELETLVGELRCAENGIFPKNF
jgi:ribonuclease M5